MSADLTIGRWLSDRARTTPDRVAIRYLDAELTYEALDRRAARLAAGLAERGLGRGDRLATLTGTSPDHVATFFACAHALQRACRHASEDIAHFAVIVENLRW